MCYDTNYDNDERVRNRGLKNRQFVVEVWTDEEIQEIELPTRFVVCPTCEGRGSHVNPSIDCNGLSSEDFAEDPDFREDYFSGRYDVTCETCEGRNVILGVDEEKCDPALLAKWYEKCDEERAQQEERIHERRMGY